LVEQPAKGPLGHADGALLGTEHDAERDCFILRVTTSDFVIIFDFVGIGIVSIWHGGHVIWAAIIGLIVTASGSMRVFADFFQRNEDSQFFVPAWPTKLDPRLVPLSFGVLIISGELFFRNRESRNPKEMARRLLHSRSSVILACRRHKLPQT
jgi:hypothetical protein